MLVVLLKEHPERHIHGYHVHRTPTCEDTKPKNKYRYAKGIFEDRCFVKYSLLKKEMIFSKT